MDLSVEKISRFLSSRQRKEIRKHRMRRAGVLVGLFRRKDEWCLLMTKRSDEVEHHKGQISFPGGAYDRRDKNIVRTALRETEEEIGLLPEKVQVLGIWDDHATPTGFIITPVIGYIPKMPRLKTSNDEVVEILKVPVSLFLQKNERVVKMHRGRKSIDVYFYSFRKHEIWGATARISRDFLRSIARKPL
jgi:8-oxo-dGTP pyrophosphatase MutT (NUDIX family)